MINVAKKHKTKSGLEVKNLQIAEDNPTILTGNVIFGDQRDEQPHAWFRTGKKFSNQDNDLDLVEVSEPVTSAE